MSRAPNSTSSAPRGRDRRPRPDLRFWFERLVEPGDPISVSAGSCVVFTVAVSGGIVARAIRGGQIDETRQRGSDCWFTSVSNE
jgi:hypothetical protein